MASDQTVPLLRTRRGRVLAFALLVSGCFPEPPTTFHCTQKRGGVDEVFGWYTGGTPQAARLECESEECSTGLDYSPGERCTCTCTPDLSASVTGAWTGSGTLTLIERGTGRELSAVTAPLQLNILQVGQNSVRLFGFCSQSPAGDPTSDAGIAVDLVEGTKAQLAEAGACDRPLGDCTATFFLGDLAGAFEGTALRGTVRGNVDLSLSACPDPGLDFTIVFTLTKS